MRRRQLRLLDSGQTRLLIAILLASGFMIANSAYLVLAGHVGGVGDDPDLLPVTYQLMLVTHVLVGLLLVVPVFVFAFWHLKRAMVKRLPGTVPTGVLLLALAAFLTTTGLFILTAANSEANAWAFLGHQIAAAALPLLYVLHRVLARDKPSWRQALRGAAGMLVLLAVMVAAHQIEVGSMAPLREGRSLKKPVVVPEVWRDPPVNDPYVPFRPVADVDPESPFFPSATTTSTGGFLPARILHHDDFPDRELFERETKEIGFSPSSYLGAQTCRRCHADIVEQWRVSAHHFASFNNPFYRKAVELTRDTVGKKTSQWCGGCHDPAIMLAGNMTKEIDPLTLEAQAGLTCLACHAIDHLHDYTGNGTYNIQDERPSPYLFFSARTGLKRFVGDYVIKSKPTVHKRRMLRPFFRTSEFCSACHKVNLDVPVNKYRWIRGQDDYDAWHNSGAALNQPMTWYEPPDVKTCQDCHMPLEEAPLGDVSAKNGMVRSHRFLGPNTGLPGIRGDHESLERIRRFRKDSLRVDVFALHREDGGTVLALDRSRPAVRPGERVQVDVVVRNKGVGHTFPGGTNDSNEGWIDFQVLLDGKEVTRSGALLPDRQVDPEAHFYQAVLVDKKGNRIAKRNAPDIHSTVYANVIPPSGSDIGRYRFHVPADAAGKQLEIRAAVKWRKFNRTYTEFVFEGKPVPDLPVDTLAENAVTLDVRDECNDPDTVAVPGDWSRFNDYGVGLIMDGDTRGAARAFREVAQLVPERVDGWRNQARALLKDGNIDAAEKMLRKASDAAPDDAKTAYFWGVLLEESGRLDKAVEAYRQVLKFYPQSRDSWTHLGQTFWRMGRYRDCIEAFLEVLKIDPENANAHHKRSLAYKALASEEQNPRVAAAYRFAWKEAEKAYLKYKLDETAPEVTREYRLAHAADNRMSQLIVVHELSP